MEIGFDEPDYFKNKEANLKALVAHKKLVTCKGGVLGVNIMAVLNNFEEMAIEAVKQKIDIIFSEQASL